MKYLILLLLSTNLYATTPKFKYGDRVRIINAPNDGDIAFYGILNRVGRIIKYSDGYNSEGCNFIYLVNYKESEIPNQQVCEDNLKKVK